MTGPHPPMPAGTDPPPAVDRYDVDGSGGQGWQVGTGNQQVNNYYGGPPAAANAVEWPVVVGRPPRQADAFQVRPGLRDRIRAGLASSGTTVLTQVVAGDGGTGKTQLAAAAFRAALTDRRAVEVAVWVTAASRAAVISAYAEAHAATHPAAGGGDDQEQADRFLSWLAGTGRRWLVVLDDLADPADLAGLWPDGPAGRVLVTTRRRDAAVPGQAAVIDVGVFTDAEAGAYLSAKLSGVAGLPAGVLVEAAGLANDVGWLPLALAHATAVIINDGITCAAYRRLLADRTRPLAELFPATPGQAGDEYAHTVAGTWSLARQRAQALDPAGLAGPMLDLISVMDPNGIPEAVLISDPARAYLHARAAASTPPPDESGPAGGAVEVTVEVTVEAARRAVRNLRRLSLVSHDPDDEIRGVRIHALAQRAGIEAIDQAALAMAVRAAAEALLATWPDVDTTTELGQALRANAAVLAGRHPDALWDPDADAVLFRHGRSLGESGLVSDAATHFAVLARTSVRRLGADQPRTLAARHNLAYWRGEAGDAAGAVAALEELLADMVRVLGPERPATLTTRHHLARLRGQAGDAAGAVAALEQLLADRLRVLGSDRPPTLATRSNLAYWRGQAGDAAGAVAAFEELLVDMVRVLGPDHPSTLTTRSNLASWRGEAGDAAGAAAAFGQLLADRLRVLGSDHPATLTTRHNLASWRGQAGDAAGAAAAFEEVLADRLRVLGPDHPDTLTARHSLASWRGRAGDAAGAADAFEEVLADRLRVLGPDHPDTLATRRSLEYWRAKTKDGRPAP